MTAYDVTLGPEKPFPDGHTATNCYNLKDALQWVNNLLDASIIDFHCPLRLWVAGDTGSGGPPHIRCVSVIRRVQEH